MLDDVFSSKSSNFIILLSTISFKQVSFSFSVFIAFPDLSINKAFPILSLIFSLIESRCSFNKNFLWI